MSTDPRPPLDVTAPRPDADTAAALQEAQRTIADLRERVALLQEFCNAGVFERDPVTMQGRWDEQMYRIFGLPVPPPGTPAPVYENASQQFFAEDRTPGSFVPSLGRAGNYSSRMRLRRTDGQVRHIHSQWKVIHDAQGHAVRVVGVNADDTDTYELAREAKKLHEEQALGLQLSDIGLWRRYMDAASPVHLDACAARHVGLPYRAEGHACAQVMERIHADDRAKVQAWLDPVHHADMGSDLAIRFVHPAGGWRHVLARRSLRRDEAGTPLAFIGAILDESERVQQLQRAQQLTRRLESAAEAARVGLWSSWLGKDEVPDWNARTYALFGLNPAQGPLPFGAWLKRCVHPDDRDRVAEASRHLASTGAGAFEIEFRALHTDGSVRWLVTRGQVTRASTDALPRIEGVAYDVTEQHEALAQLRESSQRLELTASALGLGSWEYDSSAKLVDWDATMFRLRGVDSAPRRLLHEEVWAFMHPQDRERIFPWQLEAMAQDRSWHTSFRVVWPDGTVRWLASRSLVLRDEHGRPTRRIGVNWDITEVTQAEQALHERELALAESRAKSRFLSRVSHELRTPLNAVLGFTQLLRSEQPAASAEERQRWLAHIEDAGRHLLALVDDVLDLSRAESGDLRLNLQAVPLTELVGAATALVEREVRAQGLSLVVHALPPGYVHADPLRARQVLLNLLSNAIKYNVAGGRIEIGALAEDGCFRLQVTDTGRGIAPQQLHAVFEPFNRLGAEQLGIHGAGIGLPIAKALVEQMQGQIEVDSEPGVGSTFSFTLPVALPPQTAAPRPEEQPSATPDADADADAGADATLAAAFTPLATSTAAASRVRRVLYIEDNEVNTLLVREVLAPHAWVQLETATDGRSGLQRVREAAPDLLLLDMHLPDMSGLTVLRELQADAATAGVRCVALSANAMPDDIQDTLAAGAIAYWTKPIAFPEFVDKLAALLGVQT